MFKKKQVQPSGEEIEMWVDKIKATNRYKEKMEKDNFLLSTHYEPDRKIIELLLTKTEEAQIQYHKTSVFNIKMKDIWESYTGTRIKTVPTSYEQIKVQLRNVFGFRTNWKETHKGGTDTILGTLDDEITNMFEDL